MPSTILTFRASTMDEAMDLVRRELGPDAIVVNSKEVARRRLLHWPATNSEIEISAERHDRRLNSEQPSRSLTNAPMTPRRVRTLAETLSPTTSPGEANVTCDLSSPIPQIPAESTNQGHSNPDSVLTQTSSTKSSTPQLKSEVQTNKPDQNLSQDYEKSLESLQAIVSRLERQSRPREMIDIPDELSQQYHQLIEADVEDEIARKLTVTLRRHLPHETGNSPSALTALMTVLIEQEMRCAPPIQIRHGHRKIVTLVGPTGVGKTTTLAKLAGHFHLREGLRAGLITVDTYRVGAVEQLQTYADILQIPLRAASSPEELRMAIDGLDDVDLVLIDTGGRSPFDSSKLNELQDILQAAGSDHVLLVLSLAAGPKMISKIFDQFAFAGPSSLVITKLDEVPSHGGLLSIANDIPHPIAYITAGQDVPDHFEPAHPHRLARLILGLDHII